MLEERQLAETVVTTDLFGADGLRDDGSPPVPDRYEISRCLGRGGGGSVYLARDTHLGRPVALKYLTLARAADVERFFREARFAARLNDPAIVQVYEADEIAGVPFIAMQYIGGGNLATVPLDLPDTLRVVRRVAVALQHAHDEGIVHRDVKPENILLDAERRAYVSDFGIARDLRGELGATISHDGQILGTPALMPPEQARGDVHAVDGRSDVYALGATLFFKVTGRAPFTADHLVDLLHAVIHDEPPFPRRFRADLPREVEAIVLRAMRKRPNERFASMAEFIEAIDRALSGAASPALSPIWFTSYVRRVVDDVPPPRRDPTDSDLAPALGAAQEIAAWDAQLYRIRGDLTRHYPRLDALIARLDAVLEERPETGWARFYRGVAWFRRGNLRRALEDMERAIDRVGDLAGAYFELGRLYLAIYLNEHHQAHRHLSVEGTHHQLRAARSRLDQAHIAFGEARRLKQNLPDWQMRYADAVGLLAAGDFEACAAACDAILEDDPDLEEVWKLKGDALRRLRRDPLDAYARALAIRRTWSDVLLAMAEVHLDGDHRPEARACLARALEIDADLTPARVMMARSYLPPRGGPAIVEDVQAGLELASAACSACPDRYDAAVTVAELRLAAARATEDPSFVDGALEALDRAERLDGCQNRVTYLRACARVLRARLVTARGGDGRADLDAVLALRTAKEPCVPDNGPWVALIEEAEGIAGQVSGSRLQVSGFGSDGDR